MATVKPLAAFSAQEAERRLRHCLEHGTVRPSRHFREELANEGLDFVDAWHVLLRTGRVLDPPEHDVKRGEWKYKIEGPEPEGRWLVVVFGLRTFEEAILITAWTTEPR